MQDEFEMYAQSARAQLEAARRFRSVGPEVLIAGAQVDALLALATAIARLSDQRPATER